MRASWIPWALSALLLAGVAAGLVASRATRSMVDPVPVKTSEDQQPALPKFDCRDRTVSPYEMSAQAREEHVAWLAEHLDLSEVQTQDMDAVFANASITADDFWRQTRERYCDLREMFYADMQSVLDEKQQVALERLKQEKRAKRDRDVKQQTESGYEARNEDFGKQP